MPGHASPIRGMFLPIGIPQLSAKPLPLRAGRDGAKNANISSRLEPIIAKFVKGTPDVAGSKVVDDPNNSPSPTQLAFLFVFFLLNSVTFFAVGVMLVRNVWVAGLNVTTIEGWEIERHESLVQKARAHGGYVDGPDGVRLKVVKQEFPYDIGIYRNARQAMGTTIFLWLWPLASTPQNSSSVEFETNGFEDPGTLWPPPDPDRIQRRQYNSNEAHPFVHSAETSGFDVQAFRERQRMDILRYAVDGDETSRQTPSRESSHSMSSAPGDRSQHPSGRHRFEIAGLEWHNSEGDSLGDFGVDEDADEDLPLAEIRKRLVRKH
ncbi:MAG: hypothetical protein Q9196_004178 [Gyalolechia fulgens]